MSAPQSPTAKYPRPYCSACLWHVDPTIDEGYAGGTERCPIHGPLMVVHAAFEQAGLARGLNLWEIADEWRQQRDAGTGAWPRNL